MTNLPTNLDEAIEYLKKRMDKKSINYFKKLDDGNRVHFTLGMQIRNSFGLWQPKTQIHQWFVKTYGLDHADDMSSIILDSLHRELNGLPRRDKEVAEKCHAHWKKYGKN